MSSKRPWMRLWVHRFVSDTQHLTNAEMGCYWRLLLHYWSKGPLPDDDNRLAVISHTDVRRWRRDLAPHVRPFFTLESDGLLHQKRIDQEIATAEQASTRARSAAHSRWPDKRNQPASGDAPPHASAYADAYADAYANGYAWDMPRAVARDTDEDSSLRSESSNGSLGSPRAPPPDDKRTELFRDGLARLCRLTGVGQKRGRVLLGKLLRDMADDCAGVSLILREAEEARPADPLPWIMRAAGNARDGRNGASMFSDDDG